MIRVGCTAAHHGSALLAYPPLPGREPQLEPLTSSGPVYILHNFCILSNSNFCLILRLNQVTTSTSSFLESDVSLEPQRDLQREYWNWSPLIHPSTSYKLHQDTVQYYTHNTQHSTLYMIHTPGTHTSHISVIGR